MPAIALTPDEAQAYQAAATAARAKVVLCIDCGHCAAEHPTDYGGGTACVDNLDADWDGERYVKCGGCKCPELNADTTGLLHLLDRDALVPALVALHLADHCALTDGWALKVGIDHCGRFAATVTAGPDDLLSARLFGTMDGGLQIDVVVGWDRHEARFDDGMVSEWAADALDYLQASLTTALSQLADAEADGD